MADDIFYVLSVSKFINCGLNDCGTLVLNVMIENETGIIGGVIAMLENEYE
jgi:hypothetical protein